MRFWRRSQEPPLPIGRGSKPMVPFWGRCTTHFRTYFCGWIGMFSGLTDLDFDPWPVGGTLENRTTGEVWMHSGGACRGLGSEAVWFFRLRVVFGWFGEVFGFLAVLGFSLLKPQVKL